jgi:hypothetical protein
MKAATSHAPEGIKAQRELIEKLESQHFGWDILVGDAFVRGMRDIGYKSTSFALAELIDNSVQAAATRVDIVFGFDAGAKPTQIAVVDDGYGMEPKMIRASLIWGAGTRAEDRQGFGKYGYGLPSSSVSQCTRVTVYSKTADGGWYSAYLDIDEIKIGKWTNANRIQIPEEQPEEPPAFVVKALEKEGRWSGFDHGTVIVWDGIDRVNPKRREELRNKLVTNLGVVFRNYLQNTPMTVDGTEVEPCDPLFLTEGFRYHAIDDDRAVAFPSAVVEVKDQKTGEVVGRMRVRYARMPSTFFRQTEFKLTNKPGKNTNERLEIADANNGIIFCRNGRQIDVIRPPRNMASINATTDRFWAVEVDFDATLDEMFSITTSKQQVRPDDRVWDMLKDKAKLFAAVGEMRTAYKKEAKALANKIAEDKKKKRASIEAIEQAKKFRTTKPPKDTPERKADAEENLKREAKNRGRRANVDPNAMERELIAQREGQVLVLETEDLPSAAFFRCVQEGGTRVLYLNVAHPFYTELYMGPSSTPWVRACLEVVLWALGEAEADADPASELRTFYERQRANVWSPYIADALGALATTPTMEGEAEDDSAA